MPNLLKLLFVTVFCIGVSNLKAQRFVEYTDSLAGKFISVLRTNKKEKILVQTNKWYYAAGEDLWMKALIVNELSHKYFSHSKTLFVELVNEQDTAVAQLILNIPGQQTEGYIRLKDSLREGQYWLRAYTRNMLQQHDTGSICVIPIFIMNSRFPATAKKDSAAAINSTAKTTLPLVNYFPEGGNMIPGTKSVVGVRATDESGKPLSVTGYIAEDNDPSPVTWFKTDSLTGLGKAVFFVSASKKYVAVTKWNNQLLKKDLPAINQFASQLSVKSQDENFINVVVSLGDSLYKKDIQTYLLGISRDSLCFAGIGTDMYEAFIPKKNFPAGIATLVLFNNKQEVISERAVYITKPAGDISIIADKEHYLNRDKVKLQIVTGDSLIHASLAALNVSVTDDNYVNEPEYGYKDVFVNEKDSVLAKNDLEMLTQPQLFTGGNYRDVTINDNGLSNKHSYFDGDSTITDIKGRIVNRKNQPVPNRVVTLYNTKQLNLFATDTTNADGAFTFRLLPYPDSIVFTLQVSNLKGNKVDEKIIVDIASPFPKFSTPLSLKRALPEDQVEEVHAIKTKHPESFVIGFGNGWLKEVIVKTKQKRTTYSKSKRVSNFSYVLSGEMIQSTNVNDASTAILMVPGLHLRGGFLTLGGLSSFGATMGDEPLLLVDGLRIAGGNFPKSPADTGAFLSFEATSSPVMEALSRISPDIIDFIEVLKGPEAANYGIYGGNGVILVNTHNKSNFATHIENYGSLQYLPKSYHRAPIFSMPDYDDPDVKSGTFKDFRSTLYWNGHIYTNPNGKAEVEFFTSDAKTTYTVTVTGVTASGEIIYKQVKLNSL